MMDNSSQNDSDTDFPEPPPNLMLDMGLEDDVGSNEHIYRILSNDVHEEEYPPKIIVKDESDSGSSDSEKDAEGESLTKIQTGGQKHTKGKSPMISEPEVSVGNAIDKEIYHKERALAKLSHQILVYFIFDNKILIPPPPNFIKTFCLLPLAVF